MKIIKNKNLENLNSFKLKVKAKYFCEIKNKNDILEIFNFIQKNKIKKYFILAGGSNIIFKKNFYDGLIIKISNKKVNWISKNKLSVGSGKNLDELLLLLQKKSFYQIQSLSSIPGSIGGAVFGNAGAFGQEIQNFVEKIEVFNLKTKKFEILKHEDLNFSYRNSIFKENKKYLIYSIHLNLSKKWIKEHTQNNYFSLKDFKKRFKIKNLKSENIRKEIKKIRRKYPNPKDKPNVGSTFKNIEMNKINFLKIQKKFPDIPFWENEEKIKIPTAYIFDKALNLNGKKFGNIYIDQKRPLFLINNGKSSGDEFYKLCQRIIKDVKNKTGLNLETEIIFVD